MIRALLFLLPALASATPAYLERVQRVRAEQPCLSVVVPNAVSMYPYSRGGDTLRCWWKPFKDVKRGDRVRFFPAWSSVPIAHEVILVQGDRLITKGLNNDSRDPNPVTEEIYIGLWEKI